MSRRPSCPHTLRITGGTFGGRRIRAPEDAAIRPTADKVRQAVFNILNARGLVADAIVLDAFCGTGALGIEALSHGAAHATFFDLAGPALRLCQENIKTLGLEDRTTLRRVDATRPGPRPLNAPPATLVFLDPPYKKGLISESCEALLKERWISPGATLVLESSADEMDEYRKINDCFKMENIDIIAKKRYGETGICILNPSGPSFLFTE